MDRSMMRVRLVSLASVLLLAQPIAIAEPTVDRGKSHFAFQDTTAQSGLLPNVAGIRGHAAGWGDTDGDGKIDLYVGTFHTEGSKPNMLFRNLGEGQFEPVSQTEIEISTRASASLFADLDNDGDLDLYVSSMPGPSGSQLATKEGHAIRGCVLFRNDGGGKFTDVSKDNGACPAAFGGRSASVLDYNGDGLLDLLVGEDPISGYNGSPTKSSRLLRNLGNLKFDDATTSAGLPTGVPGYGTAAADVNNDGWPDLFLAANKGGNRLFLNDGQGRFHEPAGARETFAWQFSDGDDMVCGVSFGDVNRDGWLDMVLGQHFQMPWRDPVANRLYLNRGANKGIPRFEDVTDQAGLTPLPLKAPHVEIQDFDNDGWPDVYASMVKFAEGRPYPLIFRNQGISDDGVPHFRESVLGLNDFPTAEDRAINRAGTLFEKMIREKKVIYTAPGPSGDYDQDGRLDLFLASWWIEMPSMLLHNETAGGHWLQVQVKGSGGVNRMGIGSRVRVFPAGKLGDAASLLGSSELAAGYGYASGQEAVCHFGLGMVDAVDVEVTLPHGKGVLTRKQVKADQRITIE